MQIRTDLFQLVETGFAAAASDPAIITSDSQSVSYDQLGLKIHLKRLLDLHAANRLGRRDFSELDSSLNRSTVS